VKVGGDFDGRELEAKVVLLATGSVARPVPGAQFGGRVIDTAGAWLQDELPGSIAVIGAGASGAEIASAYARLGTETTLFEALERVLPTEDADISKLAERAFKKQGITVHTETLVEDIAPGERSVAFTHGDERGEAEYLCIATGRGPDEEGLGLAEAGIELDENGQVKVDGAMRPSRPGVYAIGDVVPTPLLAHLASKEGIVAVEHFAGKNPRPINLRLVPNCTYCDPEVASVGLTEAKAREAGYDVKIGKFPFSASGKARILGEEEGFVKIVSEAKYDELLGVHIIGPHATELIAEACVAMQLESTAEELGNTMHAHPTVSEAVMEAAEGVHGKTIHM